MIFADTGKFSFSAQNFHLYTILIAPIHLFVKATAIRQAANDDFLTLRGYVECNVREQRYAVLAWSKSDMLPRVRIVFQSSISPKVVFVS